MHLDKHSSLAQQRWREVRRLGLWLSNQTPACICGRFSRKQFIFEANRTNTFCSGKTSDKNNSLKINFTTSLLTLRQRKGEAACSSAYSWPRPWRKARTVLICKVLLEATETADLQSNPCLSQWTLSLQSYKVTHAKDLLKVTSKPNEITYKRLLNILN